MSIRRLAPEVIARIAAGEVIERPASVLKELIENSLDAGSTKIVVESMSAGKKLLRVIDDGAGIAPSDCRAALERHATSKIREIDDLDRLATFGFRGEALYSIAAVSWLRLTSHVRKASHGWTLQSEGGEIRSEHEAPPVPGTTIEISDLFFNTPARLKFLKSDTSEKGHLIRVVEEASLAHPEIGFVYKSENRTVLQFPARKEASFDARIRETLGEELADGLLQVSEKTAGIQLRAFLVPIDRMPATRNFQFFFVNRRPVSSRLLQQALYRAYDAFRSRDRHPAAVVFLDISPEQFDVNVHPAKREIRFRAERPIYECLAGALSSAILSSKGIPTITPEPRIPGDGSRCEGEFRPPASTSYSIPNRPWTLADAPELDLGTASTSTPLASPRWFTPPFRLLGQIEQSYLLFEAAGGLLIVDQHAAQERILFERYVAEMENGRVRSQTLALPVEVELPASQIEHVLSREDGLKSAGFAVKAFGRTTLHVTQTPALFHEAGDVKEMIHRLLESLRSEKSAAADIQRHALATVACKTAVKAHDRLGAQEALQLLEDLRACKDGTCCPHGRPAMISLNREELARRFKRPGAPPL